MQRLSVAKNAEILIRCNQSSAGLCYATRRPHRFRSQAVKFPEYVHITNQIGSIVDYVDLYLYFETFRRVVADGEATSGGRLLLLHPGLVGDPVPASRPGPARTGYRHSILPFPGTEEVTGSNPVRPKILTWPLF